MQITPKDEARFWSKVDRSGGPEACWPWTGSTNGKRRGEGYGKCFLDGYVVSAHRIAYQLGRGADPGELFVRHACDHKPCCNPAHLTAGTHAENMADMVQRGRSTAGDRNPSRLYPERRARGERVAGSKLTPDAVREIVRLADLGEYTQREIAARFSVCPATICNLLKGRIWSHASGRAA